MLLLLLLFRNCCDDFLEIVKKNRHRFGKGVVHSFTGTAEEAKSILDLDLYIGFSFLSLFLSFFFFFFLFLSLFFFFFFFFFSSPPRNQWL